MTYPITTAEPFLMRVRGEPVGVAYGSENWFRAIDFISDRLGRTTTTPRWAVDATVEPSLYELCRSSKPDDAGALD